MSVLYHHNSLMLMDLSNNIPSIEECKTAMHFLQTFLKINFGVSSDNFSVDIAFTDKVKIANTKIFAPTYRLKTFCYPSFDVTISILPSDTTGRKNIKVNDWQIQATSKSTGHVFTPEHMLSLTSTFSLLKEENIKDYKLNLLKQNSQGETEFEMNKFVSKSFRDTFFIAKPGDIPIEHLIWAALLSTQGSAQLGEYLPFNEEVENLLNNNPYSAFKNDENFVLEYRENIDVLRESNFTVLRKNVYKPKPNNFKTSCPFNAERNYYHYYNGQPSTKLKNVIARLNGVYYKDRELCGNCTNEFHCLSSNYQSTASHLEFVEI